MPDDEQGLLVQAGGAQVSVPIEAGRFGFQVRDGSGIVRLVHILASDDIGVDSGHLFLQGRDAFGALNGIAHAGEPFQVGDIFLVGGAQRGHFRLVRHVILAIRHAESAL